MSQLELFKQFPVRRIKPYDGMVVTSDVWEEAHAYHRQQTQYHQQLSHGAGILTGLEVGASDPPDSAVYIQPGVALDGAGQMIIVPEALAYNLGTAQGPLYLLLSYEDSQPQPVEGMADASEVMLYIRAQYGLVAANTPPVPNGPFVELARLHRYGAESPITTANDAARPGPNQIDLRFRQQIGFTAAQAAKVGVCYLGAISDHANPCPGHGAHTLTRVLRQTGQPIWSDETVGLAADADWSEYALVYLVAQEGFQLSPDELNVLYVYLHSGGTLLLEVCRQGANPQAAEAALLDMLGSFGVSVSDLPVQHVLLTEPNLFAAPPAGFDTTNAASFKVGEGVIFSTYDYGCLWQGQRSGRPATREEIRAAHEWGANLIAYALARHQQTR